MPTRECSICAWRYCASSAPAQCLLHSGVRRPGPNDIFVSRFLQTLGDSQKKLSSTVTVSPGAMGDFKSILAGVLVLSFSRTTKILLVDARSLKPPAIDTALRTFNPG